jgi:hypothetical protein
MKLDLSDFETRLLSRIIDQHIFDLRYEINRTDALDYKSELREELKAFEKIANQLKFGPAASWPDRGLRAA